MKPNSKFPVADATCPVCRKVYGSRARKACTGCGTCCKCCHCPEPEFVSGKEMQEFAAAFGAVDEC